MSDYLQILVGAAVDEILRTDPHLAELPIHDFAEEVCENDRVANCLNAMVQGAIIQHVTGKVSPDKKLTSGPLPERVKRHLWRGLQQTLGRLRLAL